MRPPQPAILLPAVVAAFCATGLAPSRADVHGPVCAWHRDPTTTMTIQWIDSAAAVPAVDGIEKSWALGRAGFGYGDDDDATTFRMRGRFSRIYIRAAFQKPAGLDPETPLVLKVQFDDGFVAYLNGNEVARSHVGRGVGADADAIEPHDATGFEPFPIGRVGELAEGQNILAVEGHNTDADSSDFSLHPLLEADDSGDEPEVVIGRNATWEYLANDEPPSRWTSTLATTETGAKTAEEDDETNQPAFRLEFRPRAAEGDALAAATTPPWQPVEPSSKAFGPTASTVYHAELDGLEPDSAYEYRLVTSDDDDPDPAWFRTAPATLPEGGIRFVTGGDMFHTRELLDAMNARAGKEDPLFALLGGDLAYANGRSASRWYDFVDSWRELAVGEDGRAVPMVVAIGNHEVDGGSQPQPVTQAPFFYSLYKLPDGVSNYALDFADYLSIIILDSDHSQPVAEQTPWLADALTDREHFPWLHVCYHRPTYGTGVKVNQYNVRSEWVPLFEKHRVDVVFENDHHVYKRTHLLKDDKRDDAEGVLYIGDGAWGVGVRKIPDSVADLDYIAQHGETNHLLTVKLTAEEMKIDAVEANGNVFDTVTLPRRRGLAGE